MLFNSYEFVFVFLPLMLAGFYLLGRLSRGWAIRWLICGSLVFYAWWRPLNILIIAPSIIINFFLSRLLLRLGSQNRPHLSRVVLLVGITFNVLFLGYFKYANFGVGVLNDVVGTNLVLTQIVLPLGISFITFQKIAFLVDVYSGRISSFTLQDYALFVLFFPQLVAGPIVHYREMMPQFQQASCRFDRENFSIGLTLFMFGLFKKTYLADGIAPMVTPIYEHAAGGGSVTLFAGWIAAIGYTLQIYFDFSGYTDMALGLARFVGIKLPPNFNSPLKATSIIEFWQRWHITLTRFLTAYIYNPLALALTRRRLAKGGKPFAGAGRTPGAFLQLVMFPTLVTMFISGLWHGAGYLFILWGVVHGVYIAINQAWRLIAAKRWPDRQAYARRMAPIGFVITFFAIVAAMVLFRGPTPRAAISMFRGMFGLGGVGLPRTVLEHMGPLAGWLQGHGVMVGFGVPGDPIRMIGWTVCLLLIALLAPNTLQLLAEHEPALGYQPEARGVRIGRINLAWQPSMVWAVVASMVAAVGMLHLGGQSEFLYWQF